MWMPCHPAQAIGTTTKPNSEAAGIPRSTNKEIYEMFYRTRVPAPFVRRIIGHHRAFHSSRHRLASSSVDAASRAGAKSWTGVSVAGVALLSGVFGWAIAGNTKRYNTESSSPSVSTSPAANESTRRYASIREMEQAIEDIRKVLGNEEMVSTDPEDLHRHGYSEWSTVNPDRLPVAVVYPRSTNDVSVIVRTCNEYSVPVIAYSGGTSLEGNFSAPHGGISIDFAFMDQIIKFNKDDMDIVVQPSVGWQDLNAKLAEMESGLFFPVDPGPTAKIGGMIGTNCSGTNAVRYGTMKDWIINLTVVLADGRIIKTKRRPRKSSAGYNLNGLFIGSEGTLGIVTEATLKLAAIPDEFSVAVVTFPSVRDAAAAAASVMQAAIPVACLELMDELQMRVINLSGSTAPRQWRELPTLFFKFSGTASSVADNIDRVRAITAKNNGGDFEFAKDAAEQKLLWSARKESLWSMLALRKENEDVWSTDVAVPFSRLADIIEVTKKDLESLGLFATILGHVGDGNFHASIMYNKKDAAEYAKVEKCVKDMVKRALEMEGTCTGEHGVGWGKKSSLLLEVGPETLGVMKDIKQSLDPKWIMNPSKIMDVPGLEDEEKKLTRQDVVGSPAGPGTTSTKK